jgi:hypothetical protein
MKKEIKEPLPEVSKIIMHIGTAETNMNAGRSLENARPLKEFDQLDWIPIDFGHQGSNIQNERSLSAVKKIEDPDGITNGGEKSHEEPKVSSLQHHGCPLKKNNLTH